MTEEVSAKRLAFAERVDRMVPQAVSRLEALGELGSKKIYDYHESDVAVIVTRVRESVTLMEQNLLHRFSIGRSFSLLSGAPGAAPDPAEDGSPVLDPDADSGSGDGDPGGEDLGDQED